MKRKNPVQLRPFIRELEEAEIYFELAINREDAISVMIAVPGERWEVDFLDDGSIDVERFVSSGELQDESALKNLFSRFDERNFQIEPPAKRGIKQRKSKKIK